VQRGIQQVRVGHVELAANPKVGSAAAEAASIVPNLVGMAGHRQVEVIVSRDAAVVEAQRGDRVIATQRGQTGFDVGVAIARERGDDSLGPDHHPEPAVALVQGPIDQLDR
jgi:hypothetical protein